LEERDIFVVRDAEGKLKEMVRRIVAKFDPQRIILFGSRARGSARPDSDADLLVVMDVEGSRFEATTRVRMCVRGMGLPKDIVVVTPRDMEKYAGAAGSVIQAALREGKVLYERATG